MKYVFGPVPSRRLGQSLGIDTVPLKTCNWNCVYCQLGRTQPLTPERKEYAPSDVILAETRQALASHPPGSINWVTFVGSGEGTLHRRIGWLIRQVKALTEIPVAVITNGTLLHRADVRAELSAADAVLPTLDAGSEELYRRINRPHPRFTFAQHLEGLRAFRQAYRGQLWVEVMLIRGLNDTEAALRDLAECLRGIRPDQVHLVQPTRPPGEPWVQPPDAAGIRRAADILGDVARVVSPMADDFRLSEDTTPLDAILAIITRHPMEQEQLEKTLGRWGPQELHAALTALESSGRAQTVRRHGKQFWTAAGLHFTENADHGGG